MLLKIYWTSVQVDARQREIERESEIEREREVERAIEKERERETENERWYEGEGGVGLIARKKRESVKL